MRDGSTFSAWPTAASAAAAEFDPRPAAHAQGWASLLEWFYQRAGLSLPRLEQVRPEAVPQPYRSILVHSDDMTPTLETFFGVRPGLSVLGRETGDESYRREVVLTLGSERRPVLYGVIRILLGHLPERAWQRVLRERHPLGHILQTEAIPHLSWPQTFFRVEADAHMTTVLRLKRAWDLYGRRNVLVDGTRRLLAEVIEVLGPVESRE